MFSIIKLQLIFDKDYKVVIGKALLFDNISHPVDLKIPCLFFTTCIFFNHLNHGVQLYDKLAAMLVAL